MGLDPFREAVEGYRQGAIGHPPGCLLASDVISPPVSLRRRPLAPEATSDPRGRDTRLLCPDLLLDLPGLVV